MKIEIKGANDVHKMLRAYTDPTLTKRVQGATKAGAQVFGPALKAEARPVSRRMNRGVSVRKAKRDRPATVVSIRPKVAFFRHFLILGTRRGIKPNPIVARVAARLEGQAYAAIDRDLDRTE